MTASSATVIIERQEVVPTRRPAAPPEGGWLAPDGRLWPCRTHEHHRVAGEVARAAGFPVTDDVLASLHMDAAGWIHLWPGGHLMRLADLADRRVLPTQAQLDALFDLAMRHPELREALMGRLREWARMEDGVEPGGPWVISLMWLEHRAAEAGWPELA
jgi:hypothetical protein